MHHYTECGLDNVWLANGYTTQSTAYGPGISVAHADELLALLAQRIVGKPGRLSGKEFRFLRVQMGISQAALARAQGVSEQAVSLWERHGKVPKANDALIRLCYLSHAQGDEPLRKAFHRVMEVERLIHQKIVATAGPKGWKSTVEEEATQPVAS
ncbi:hypothetical protein [Roseateles terrae]|uniref:DNA-binding transcriptional regulator YiaG n=1 Tax=Roseateles terrae TaxID=431060 RepID=A0ABR6GL89_9BURK|nr:hypothetical protein [Roseateles terrae]MBB3192820.1 DNA-binding transcriptional regulator YiaG [Roseateles terrae]OWQ89912.1 hypothetical protein CDN98_05305 [Roseateles terrae]